MLKIVREFIDKDTNKLVRANTYLTGKDAEREKELVEKGLALQIKSNKKNITPKEETKIKTKVINKKVDDE